MNKKMIVSGGGTGGHIFPAIAIANAMKAEFPDMDILFIGANGRMEMKRVPEAGYKIEGLDIYGLQRKITFKNLIENCKLPFRLIKSNLKAKNIIKSFQPDVVVGVGGYASYSALNMAVKLGIPTLIHEANSYPGMANKKLGSKVDKICITYDSVAKYFPKKKLVKTGNPIRKDILEMNADKSQAAQYFGLDSNKKTLAVIGGSLGAKTINQSVATFVEDLVKQDIQLVWQTGESYYNSLDDKYKNLPGIKVLPFVSRMDLLYTIADVVVSRAGALSLSELCTIGKPCILVPSPNVAEDHQTKNATVLADAGAAIMVADAEAKEKLATAVMSVLNDTEKQQTMRNNLLKMGQPDAAKIIAQEIIKLIEGNK